MPRISVIMGVFNAASYLEMAINSILEQTYDDFEFIICDDGSTDNTADILMKHAKRDSRIIIIKNESNKGLGYSLNRCVEIAKGEFLLRMDGDDISVRNRIEILVNTAIINPDFAVIGTSMTLFDNDGEWGKTTPIELPNKIQIFKGPAVAHATTIMKTEIIKKVGAYNHASDKCHAEDYDLWCRLTEGGYLIMSIPDKLYKCRWDRVTYYQRRKLKHLIGISKLKFFWANRFNLGVNGWLHCGITLLKAFTPPYVKKIYHRYKLQ